MLLTRRLDFSASHRVWRPDWGEERNLQVFGPHASGAGHGHNYALEVTLRGDFDSKFESIDARFDSIDAQFDKIDARFEKIDDRLYDFHETLRSYARPFLVVQTATVFGVAGIVLGITRLL